MSDEVIDELGEFLDFMWHDTRGFAYVPVEQDGVWVNYTFSWPTKRAGVIRHILKFAAVDNANVFFSPALYRASKPIKTNVLGAWTLWVDFDGNAPEGWPDDVAPRPSMRVQSSLEHNQHCYWQLSEFVDSIDVLEERNRALAYVLGADTSGWDADQILRPIHTINQKRGLPVHVKEWPR